MYAFYTITYVTFIALFITFAVLYAQAKQNTPSAPEANVRTVTIDFGGWTPSQQSCTTFAVESTDQLVFVETTNWTPSEGYVIRAAYFSSTLNMDTVVYSLYDPTINAVYTTFDGNNTWRVRGYPPLGESYQSFTTNTVFVLSLPSAPLAATPVELCLKNS